MRALLNDSNFDTLAKKPHSSRNDTKEEFAENLMDFCGDVIAQSKEGPVVAFIHASSHGCILKEDPQQYTWMVHKDAGEFTPIQSLAINLSLKPNVQVFMLLDMCRNV